MNGLSYPNNTGGGEFAAGTHHYNGSKLNGGYEHVEDGGDSYNDDDEAFDSNNIDSYFDQEADENQGLEDDADLDGYLNDLYGSESAPDHHGKLLSWLLRLEELANAHSYVFWWF